MKRHHLLYLTFCLGLVTVGAFFYLDSPDSHSEGLTPVAGSPGLKATDATSAELQSAGEQNESVASVSNSTPAKHPSATAPVIPEKYTTAPRDPWKKEIIGLVNRLDMTDMAKAEQLLGRLNSLPIDGKVLALDHATKLISDEDYVRMRPKIFGLASSPELRETVLLDVLTRGEPVRMPTLVEILRQPAHPGQEEVREILLAYLDVDYGNDVNGWDTAVKKFLADNPDL